jgi:hypothetical protein
MAVYVTIKEIDVHFAGDTEGSWKVLAEPGKTVNLLELANGVREQLALIDLAPGHYDQLRLIIGDVPDSGTNILGTAHPSANYVIAANDAVHDMKIPSGMQTGIKLVQGFDINANSTTELTFDFDASRSVVKAGNSGKYILKPTIKVIDDTTATVIGGMVTTMEGQTAVGVGGALVGVQVYDSQAADAKDQIDVMTSTFTSDADATRGAYKFFFAVAAPTTINLVAGKDGFVPMAQRFEIQNGTAYTKDFALVAPTTTGTVAITITGAGAGVPVTVSLRQSVTLGTDAVMIEVKSIMIADGNPPNFTMPTGEYTLVAWTDTLATKVVPVSVTSGQTASVTVAF